MTDDRKARVTREMELLGPEAMTRSLRAFPRLSYLERGQPCDCVLGLAYEKRGFYGEAKRILGVAATSYSAMEAMYEDGDPDLLHTWILAWLELDHAVPAPVPVAAPVPPIAADCPGCCQVEYGITRHCADHCEEGMPF